MSQKYVIKSKNRVARETENYKARAWDYLYLTDCGATTIYPTEAIYFLTESVANKYLLRVSDKDHWQVGPLE